MRNFQVSDVRREYGFGEYHRSRILTTIAMFVIAAVYVIFAAYQNGYSTEKTQIILWMCAFKLPDAYEDVFFGEYQRNNRLDVASKAMTLRLLLTIIVFGILVFITRDLLLSMILSTLFTVLLMTVLLYLTRDYIKKEDGKKLGTRSLLPACFPVFAATFLSYYIGNAPKYAIDSQLSDDLQAIYGFISMPVFVVGLLNSFIFNPI